MPLMVRGSADVPSDRHRAHRLLTPRSWLNHGPSGLVLQCHVGGRTALYRKHKRLERNRTLIKKKKQHVLAVTGAFACEVCNFNSKDTFGIEWVIDIHHTAPLRKIGKSRTRLSDLALVCPTCHRTIHAHKPFVTPAELRAKLKADSRVAVLE